MQGRTASPVSGGRISATHPRCPESIRRRPLRGVSHSLGRVSAAPGRAGCGCGYAYAYAYGGEASLYAEGSGPRLNPRFLYSSHLRVSQFPQARCKGRIQNPVYFGFVMAEKLILQYPTARLRDVSRSKPRPSPCTHIANVIYSAISYSAKALCSLSASQCLCERDHHPPILHRDQDSPRQ